MRFNLDKIKQRTYNSSKSKSQIQPQVEEEETKPYTDDLEEVQSTQKEDKRENNLSSIKVKIPPFKGRNDTEAYLK